MCQAYQACATVKEAESLLEDIVVSFSFVSQMRFLFEIRFIYAGISFNQAISRNLQEFVCE